VSWGPSHQATKRRPRRPLWVLIPGFGLIGWWLLYSDSEIVLLAVVLPALLLLNAAERVGTRAPAALKAKASEAIARGDDPHAVVREACRGDGGGPYLGVRNNGDWRFARPQRAVLVLGPPRSGKTTGVIVPTLLAHTGPVVTTSTKPDVLAATAGARSEVGKLWEFDPTGASWAGVGERLRWSPVFTSRDWERAQLMARAMVQGTRVGSGTTEQTHWSRRAQALLAPLLHAAAVGGREIDAVLEWVLGHDLDEPTLLLEQNHGSELATGLLGGLQNTEGRERSSIFSAAADALDAYTSREALQVARDQNFHPERFAASHDTIYIHAPSEHQAAAAPLVCGLLADIRRAVYHAHRDGTLRAKMLFALDEVANIAPLDELPQIASEGAGQGLALLAALQDLSQARGRWGQAADGFLTLFGTKLILPGIADPKTLEAISLTLGEYDRQIVSTTTPSGTGIGPFLSGSITPRQRPSQTVSTHRERVLPPGEIAGIPAGKAFHLDGVRWELLTLTPAFRAEPWRTISQLPIKGAK
jgi:type IV secretory pathway TraG/TraD family ATPase VirD4